MHILNNVLHISWEMSNFFLRSLYWKILVKKITPGIEAREDIIIIIILLFFYY